MDKHLVGALLYASIPLGLALYLFLIDIGAFEDKTGHDEFYQTILEHRVATAVAAIVLVLFAAFEFFRYLGAFQP